MFRLFLFTLTVCLVSCNPYAQRPQYRRAVGTDATADEFPKDQVEVLTDDGQSPEAGSDEGRGFGGQRPLFVYTIRRPIFSPAFGGAGFPIMPFGQRPSFFSQDRDDSSDAEVVPSVRRPFRPFPRPNIFDSDVFGSDDEETKSGTDSQGSDAVIPNRRPGGDYFGGDFGDSLRRFQQQMDAIRRLFFGRPFQTPAYEPQWPFRIPEIPPNTDNSTFETKVVNGSVVTINETVKSSPDNSFVFHFKVIQVHPQNSTNATTTIEEEEVVPAVKTEETDSRQNIPSEEPTTSSTVPPSVFLSTTQQPAVSVDEQQPVTEAAVEAETAQTTTAPAEEVEATSRVLSENDIPPIRHEFTDENEVQPVRR